MFESVPLCWGPLIALDAVCVEPARSVRGTLRCAGARLPLVLVAGASLLLLLLNLLDKRMATAQGGSLVQSSSESQHCKVWQHWY